MKLRRSFEVIAWCTMIVGFSCCAVELHAQKQEDAGAQTTTDQRIETEPWWPTLSSRPLAAFAGTSVCASCHSDEDARDPATSMQKAAARLNNAGPLTGKPSWTYSSAGVTYTLVPHDAGVDYSVAGGAGSLSRKLDWVMGAGSFGYTFLYLADDHWYQSRISLYVHPSQLDVTTGLSIDGGDDLAHALGQRLNSDDVRHCFGCHTVHSTTSRGFNPEQAEAGIGCEACHGPALMHANTMRAAERTATGGEHALRRDDANVFNPAKLSPADSIDFCGSCHRTFADVKFSAMDTKSPAVVRFQPYRLEESKCWRKTLDARLTCVACHDPHEPLNRNLASYDKQCQQCHTTSAGSSAAEHAVMLCPKAKTGCVTCHMPKVAVSSMHGEFTDHFIRVVREGESFRP